MQQVVAQPPLAYKKTSPFQLKPSPQRAAAQAPKNRETERRNEIEKRYQPRGKVRPARGWVAAAEVALLPDASGQEDRALEAVSLALRQVKQYRLGELQEMGDEFDWGIEFLNLARERIVSAVRGSSPAYPVRAIQMAAKAKGEVLRPAPASVPLV